MARNDIPEYKIWKNMRARCNAPCNSNSNYQTNNIKICVEWNDFDIFYRDMGSRPTDKHSIDRIDNNGNYCKENCRWATADIQTKNRGTFNDIYTYNGESKILKDWSRHFNIKYSTLYLRIKREGLSFEEAISKQNRYCNYSLNGEVKSLKDWCMQYNIKYQRVVDRVRRGWNLEKALTT